jgi:hypothetical protein
LPAESGVPLSRWSAPELAREATTLGIATFVSASTIRRWLRADAIKPWQHRSWIFITDPGFRAKAQRVLDLYARTFDSVTLGEVEYVISADEKTSIQARCRCHPTLAPGQATRGGRSGELLLVKQSAGGLIHQKYRPLPHARVILLVRSLANSNPDNHPSVLALPRIGLEGSDLPPQ